jgi:hypothetical protein
MAARCRFNGAWYWRRHPGSLLAAGFQVEIERRRSDDQDQTEHGEQGRDGDGGVVCWRVSRGGVTENTGEGVAVEVTT